ncbi:MAG: hypothetical protein M3018_05945 [Actinomycetota bacterium]|nr:hypothetical protein [Actinomycetota bacterium]
MKRMIALLALLLALAAPATSLASGGSSCQAYNPQLCGSVSDSTAKNVADKTTLPFTGVNVGLLALGGVTLLGAGLAVRRLAGSAG